MLHDRISRSARLAIAAGLMVASSTVFADVKLPGVLGDHMVLQEGMAVPIWGSADAGEQVTVTFGDQKQTATADDKGHWQVKLQDLKTSDQPAELKVAGKNEVTLKDILVGEVWVCSGQSNMEFAVRSARNASDDIAQANFPTLRLFTVPRAIEAEPQSDIHGKSSWDAATPQTVPGFSAVGYFFGRDLENALHVPIGLIHTSWGGTPAEAWTERRHLEGDADFKPIVERADPERLKADYEAQMKRWEEASAKAKAEGSKAPGKPAEPAHNPNVASVLYNGMVQPVVPFAIKGAIWYQGESNASRAYQYRKLLPTMIQSWRDAWGEPNLDFYIVSLANFREPPKEPEESDWAELREAQAMTAAQPHNGQALAIDLADAENPNDIHPKDKQDVGHRLALVALAKTYGKPVDYSGPQYVSNKIDGEKVTLTFQFADGLTAKGGGPLKGFQIAGEDKKWHWADAQISGDTVVVSSPDVKAPAAVRYDWATNPQGNLYNKADLPAAPFRTDDWPGQTQKNK